MFGFIVLLVAIFISRIINERALKKLSSDEKSKLLDNTANQRIYNLGVMIALIALYFFGVQRFPQYGLALTFAFVSLAVLFSLSLAFINYSKFQRLNLPTEYITQFLLSLGVQYAGLIFYIFVLARII